MSGITVHIEGSVDIPPGDWPTTRNGEEAEVRLIGFRIYPEEEGATIIGWPQVVTRRKTGGWSAQFRYSYDRTTVPDRVKDEIRGLYREAFAELPTELMFEFERIREEDVP